MIRATSFLSLLLVLTAMITPPAFARDRLVRQPALAPEPAPAAEVTIVRPPVTLFEPPAGLTKDMVRLLWELGYVNSPDAIVANPLTYRFCMDVAVKCHVQGRYIDSMAFVQRAITLRPTTTALYLEALNEIALGQGDNAVASLTRLKSPESIKVDYDWLREKLSSPLTVRAALILEVI